MLKGLLLSIALFVPSLALAGSIHGSTGAAPPATCPNGTTYTNSQGNGDGCAGANTNGSYQDKTWFADVAQSGQTLQRPTGWNVAGVDYPVGYDKTLSLTVAWSSPPPDCSLVNGTGGAGNQRELSCTLTQDRTWNGYDFTYGQVGGISAAGACTYVRVTTGAHNLTISNSSFAKGPNCYQQASITIVSGTGNRTYTNNTFNGKFGTTPLPDPEFMVVDNASAGAATFEYNYCPNQQDQCVAGLFPTSLTFFYNLGDFGRIGGVWGGAGTISGTTFTVNTTTTGQAPLPGQTLNCTGTCTGFTSGIIIDSGGPTVFTMHTAPGDGTFSTLNTKANHGTFLEAFGSGNPITLEDIEFNTTYTPSTAPAGANTSTWEFNGALTGQTLTKGVIANNTIVTNRSGGAAGTTSTEGAIYTTSLANIGELDIEDNYVGPIGSQYCQINNAPTTGINGTLSNGSGAPGNILNVTAKSGDIIPVGGILFGSTATSTTTSPAVAAYGTGGTTGTGSTGTYQVNDATQNITLSGAKMTTGIATVNFGPAGHLNINMQDGSSVTIGGPQFNTGTCNGNN